MKKAFVFPGQGSQSIGMGKDLYDRFAVAKGVFDEVDDALGQKLSSMIFSGNADELTQTENAQPAIMAVGMAIVRVLESETGKKINELTDCVAGHSLGEYTALCAAGSLTIDQTAKILRERGLAMKHAADHQPGGMAAILGLNIEKVREILIINANGVCVVANDNCPGQAVISGQNDVLEKMMDACKAAGAKRAIKLPVSGAFHSPLMADAAEQMKGILADIDLKNPIVPLVANVTALFETDASVIKGLLVKQVTGSVLWTDSVNFMAAKGVTEFVECGNGSVLTGLVKKILTEPVVHTLNSVESIEMFLKN